MLILPDTNLWILLMRARTPRAVKLKIAPFAGDPQACLAEPVVFEVLRSATDAEAHEVARLFQHLRLLPTPDGLWKKGADLGRVCRRAGLTVGSIDLLIAAVAIDYDVEIVTFDADFLRMASVSKLRVKLLT